MSTDVSLNLMEIRTTIPPGVTLVAVSKFQPVELLMQAYDAGQRIFGESKVQEVTAKQAQMPKDIEWHFIGHLQTNKVKQITPFVAMIESIDSLRLLKEVEKCAAKDHRVVDLLLQVHIAQEETKFGFSHSEVIELLRAYPQSFWKNSSIRGLMGMASFTDDEAQIQKEFEQLTSLFEVLKQSNLIDPAVFNVLSFGMSDDYKLAIKQGSTNVRIGSKLFGTRNY